MNSALKQLTDQMGPTYARHLHAFIVESNLIENIEREPTQEEILEAHRFMQLDRVPPQGMIHELEKFVSVYQPGAVLRRQLGHNVTVGGHMPPSGGPQIEMRLRDLLSDIEAGLDPWTAHNRYETLHPFSDGNGRSGRMLWAWQMGPFIRPGMRFLRMFYYQTLQNWPGRR